MVAQRINVAKHKRVPGSMKTNTTMQGASERIIAFAVWRLVLLNRTVNW